jgi:hypothetical protein
MASLDDTLDQSTAHSGNAPARPAVTRRTRRLLATIPEKREPVRILLVPPPPPPSPMAYGQLVHELKRRYKIAVRKWHRHMRGVAYELAYRDGRIKRLIAAPRPKSPVSAAIFLHEVGHHAIGFKRYASRCLEEHYVWQWTFREMESRKIPITPAVMRHFRRSMYHYVKRARRRAEHVPAELAHYIHWPG